MGRIQRGRVTGWVMGEFGGSSRQQRAVFPMFWFGLAAALPAKPLLEPSKLSQTFHDQSDISSPATIPRANNYCGGVHDVCATVRSTALMISIEWGPQMDRVSRVIPNFTASDLSMAVVMSQDAAFVCAFAWSVYTVEMYQFLEDSHCPTGSYIAAGRFT